MDSFPIAAPATHIPVLTKEPSELITGRVRSQCLFLCYFSAVNFDQFVKMFEASYRPPIKQEVLIESFQLYDAERTGKAGS